MHYISTKEIINQKLLINYEYTPQKAIDFLQYFEICNLNPSDFMSLDECGKINLLIAITIQFYIYSIVYISLTCETFH